MRAELENSVIRGIAQGMAAGGREGTGNAVVVCGALRR